MYINYIKNVRKEKHLTLKQLSILSGVSPSHIYQIENLQSIPTIIVSFKIASALNTNITDLFKC